MLLIDKNYNEEKYIRQPFLKIKKEKIKKMFMAKKGRTC